MIQKLAIALSEISEPHIAEAAGAKKRHRRAWIGSVAAVLALVLLIQPILAPTTATASGLIAAPEYPEMAPYPDESQYYGSNDWDSFDKEFTLWRTSQKEQYDQPEGYADSLTEYFARSIPEFLASDDGANTVCSPLNIYMALAMLAETADGNSRRQILNLLNANSITALRTQAGYVWNAHYSADGATSSILANSLWLKEDMAYNTQTVETLAENYYASVYQGDLGSDEVNQALRDWLNEQTGGLLEEQVQNVEMDPRTVLALASTILYRVKWSTEFREENNTEGVFHSSDGDTDATYMHQELSYGPYFWGEDFSAVYLTLEDNSQMWLILPDEGFTPADILESGHALELVLGDWNAYENQSQIRVNLSLPKFDVSADMRLNEKLQNLGITDVFDESKADFSAILPDDAVFLSSAQHAARVAIDEEGITAAAYTVMAVCGAGMPLGEEIDFVLDRPFLFVITSQDDLPLFAGVVNDPT